MNGKVKSLFIVAMLLALLVACSPPAKDVTTGNTQNVGGGAVGTPTSENQADTGATPAQSGQLLNFNQVSTPGSTLNAASVNQQPIATSVNAAPAGGEAFAGQVNIVNAGGGGASAQSVQEFTVPQATNLDKCPQGFKASMSATGDVSAQVPYCTVISVMGSNGTLNLNLSPGDLDAYHRMIGVNSDGAIFLSGFGKAFVNGSQIVLSALPAKIAFGPNDVAAMTFDFTQGGFGFIEFKDARLEAKAPVQNPIDDAHPNVMRLVEAGFALPGQNNYCAWSINFSVEATSGNVQYYPVDCWEYTFSGEGTITVTFNGDSIGWDTSAQGQRMALWVMGNASVEATCNGVTSQSFVPAKGSPGVELTKNGHVTLKFTLQKGQFLVVPFGQFKSNIFAQYCKRS